MPNDAHLRFQALTVERLSEYTYYAQNKGKRIIAEGIIATDADAIGALHACD